MSPSINRQIAHKRAEYLLLCYVNCVLASQVKIQPGIIWKTLTHRQQIHSHPTITEEASGSEIQFFVISGIDLLQCLMYTDEIKEYLQIDNCVILVLEFVNKQCEYQNKVHTQFIRYAVLVNVYRIGSKRLKNLQLSFTLQISRSVIFRQ